MADQAAVDAMTAALGDFATGKITEETVKEPENAEPPTGSDAGEPAVSPDDGKDDAEGETGETGEEGEEGDGETDGEEAGAELPATEADVNPRRPDGTFKKKEEVEAEKAAIRDRDAKKAAAGEPAKEPVTPKAKDPVNDPIPAGLKAETRERMQTLVTTAKEQRAVIEQQQVLFDAIADTGANADEFGLMLGYMRAVHSDKPEDLQFAHDLLSKELRGIAIKLGKPVTGVDLLADHKDLNEAVENGTLTRDIANEVAVSRERAKQATARTQATQQTTTAQQQAQEAGRMALNDLGETLAAVDPQYEQKKALALKKLGGSLAAMPPDQWTKAFKQAYTSVQLAPPVAPATAGSKPQPLRANKQPTGQGAKQPGNALEAMNAALADKFGV